MSDRVTQFDDVRDRIVGVLDTADRIRGPLFLVRDLWGRVRVAVPDAMEDDDSSRAALGNLGVKLQERLGAYGYPADNAILFVEADLLEALKNDAREVRSGVYWVDRLVTGRGWWTVGDLDLNRQNKRFTLYSVKGGVGRSTTAAVLARHLAANGERLLVVDLDLESPGLSSAIIEPGARPAFGVTDWFVEDLVGQGDQVIGEMTATPAWAQDLEGEVHVVPAHGREPGEYLAKLGRVLMDVRDPWTVRLEGLLSRLEVRCAPTIVLLESRSGLHDVAAATVSDLAAQVLLFATDSDSTWTDYDILFRHWQRQGLATSIRERLSIVSALTPELDTARYLGGFRERSWDLFRNVYDAVASSDKPGDVFSFDLDDELAPHHPVAIHWSRGLAAGTSLRALESAVVPLAYGEFLRWFDGLLDMDRGESR